MWQTIKKEITLITRDTGGLVILFLMPLLLILIVTFVQDGTYRNFSKEKIAILLIDNDKDEISQKIKEHLDSSALFNIVSGKEGKPFTEEMARRLVLQGKYVMAIVVPEKLSSDTKLRVNQNVSRMVSLFSGMSAEETTDNKQTQAKNIRLYFDPTLQASFKETVKGAIRNMMAEVETHYIYHSLEEYMEAEDSIGIDQQSIVFEEISPKSSDEKIIPNSVQHNVPAWALFAIFFIVIPLSTNIIKEKTQGTGLRVFTSPQPYSLFLTGKIVVYIVVSLIQFVLMLLVGLYIFPLMGLPSLVVTGKITLLAVMAAASGLSAIALGVLLGTLAKTQEQAAPLGATITVILAAIGGVWIPVFAMPHTMQTIAKISPMNWGLQGFYDILLRDGGCSAIAPEIGLLLAFSAICFCISIYYEKFKKSV
ncbi:MAG: ABC transporter permease [Bacteroidetes bacterium]|jgi:ABC transporter, permease protein|nr:MAG: ABC transporter permease [Bacteroidota bacterium]